MSSPVLRRFSSNLSQSSMAGSFSPHSQEEMIQAYEAEEERIINILSRKLEKLREDKINLENALEQESESHVNRLSREISTLRLMQNNNANIGTSSETTSTVPLDPRYPSTEATLDAMRRENESLRNRLVEAERNYIHITRLNDMYREELIEHRRRLGLPVDNLIGLPSTTSEPTHRRTTTSSSPTTSTRPLPSQRPPAHNGALPIPRAPSQIHRSPHQINTAISSSTTPLTASPTSSIPSPTPFPFSPPSPLNTFSQAASYQTQVTTPPSSSSAILNALPSANHPWGTSDLSYPHVPPPSLSSSLGSPPVAFFAGGSSVAPSRRNSRVAETGSLVRSRRATGADAGVGGASSREPAAGARSSRTRNASRSPAHSPARNTPPPQATSTTPTPSEGVPT